MDFDQDKVRCQYEAQLATANLPTGYGMSGAIASGVEQGIRQAELIKLCMQTKGWSLQQVANQSDGGAFGARRITGPG